MTELYLHRLEGCGSQPLAHYLKALAILRVATEQADEQARGFWRSDVFHLVTRLGRDELVELFSERYAPTPLVAPWNGGSGFYPKDSKDGIEPLATSTAQRFEPYAQAIAAARAAVGGRDASPKNEEKEGLLQHCRDRWQGPVTDWLDAAYVLTVEGGVRYPALLGTGGNDGRLDFTNNFMQRLVELFDPASGEPRAGTRALLEAALFGGVQTGMVSKAVGQFLPGGAGGANSTSGYSGDALFNPWDFVLMLEGALLLEVAAVRRLDARGLPQAAAPFAVRARAAGYGSAAGADEGSRGEQWFPLWSAPSTLDEVRALFDEGRLRIGRRDARDAVDAARAVARLGVARGVEAFERYGYVERNGQANLAVPLGRWTVVARPQTRLIDEVDGWLDRLRRAAKQTEIAALQRAVRRIDDAVLEVCRVDTAAAWAVLLQRLGEAEDLLRMRPRTVVDRRLQPLPRLSPGWIDTLGGSSEVRLAIAIASQYEPAPAELGSIRRHCLPLTDREDRFATTEGGFVQDGRVVWTGRDLVTDLAAIAMRRATDARRRRMSTLGLISRHPASLDDVQAWVSGRLDDRTIASLARPLMAVRWWQAAPKRRLADGASTPAALFALFRVLFPTPGALEGALDVEPRPSPDILRLLVGGRIEDAARRAARRLTASGVRPKLERVIGSAELGRRIAAAMVIPLAPNDQQRLLRQAARPTTRSSEPDHTKAVSEEL